MGSIDTSETWYFEDLEKDKVEYVSDTLLGTENRVVWDDYEVDSYLGMEVVYQQRWKNGEPFVTVPGIKSSDEFYPQEDDFEVNTDEKVLEVASIPEDYVEEVKTFIERKDVRGELDVIDEI